MFINLLRIAIIFFTFGTVDILETYTLHSIDNIVYEDLSLRDIFESGNLVVNNDFSDGTIGWTTSSNSFTVTNGIANVIETTGDRGTLQSILSSSIENNNIYYCYRLKINSLSGGTIDFRLIDNSYNVRLYVTNNTIGDWVNVSNIFNVTSTVERILFIDSASGLTWNIELDYIYLLNLSNLFTTAPTQTQLDEWLSDYLEYKDNPSFEYTFKTLGIEHLILFTTSMLFWFYSLKLLRKAVK